MFAFPLSAIEVVTACGVNEEARSLAHLILKDNAQQRQQLTCNRLLSQLAQQKADEMARTGMVQHNLGGSPNSRLRQGGYPLPAYYGFGLDNQVEAIAGGYENAEVVWEAFKKSKSHRQHLLGELEFYLEQDELGVGFVYQWASPHVEYWVVYLAKHNREPAQHEFKKEQVPNKSPYELLIREK
jgi:uncharacterized protein YkwD